MLAATLSNATRKVPRHEAIERRQKMPRSDALEGEKVSWREATTAASKTAPSDALERGKNVTQFECWQELA